MELSNKIVHGMWIGNTISNMELLTIKSFIAHGHQFYLWVYDNPEIDNISGLVLKDATEIIPRSYVFSYKNKNKYGHGKGSYAGFSDIFRYKLLYEYGGWWVDMDVTCLKAFDFKGPYVFRQHHNMSVVGNVMKCPKGSNVMKSSYEKAIKEVDAENTDWHKPISILNEFIVLNKLTDYIRKDLSYPDDWRVIRSFIKRNVEYDSCFYFIHWLNEEWRARNLSKDRYRYNSLLGRLMRKYEVDNSRKSKFGYLVNYLKTSVFYENLRLLNVVE